MLRLILTVTLSLTLVACGGHEPSGTPRGPIPYVGDGYYTTANGVQQAPPPAAAPAAPAAPLGTDDGLTDGLTPIDGGLTPIGSGNGLTPIGDGPTPIAGGLPGAVPSFNQEIQPIFTTNCTTCHAPGGSFPGLNLQQGAAYEAIVAQPSGQSNLNHVAPGDSALSYLYRKVAGTHLGAGGSGAQMPAGFPQIAALELDLLKRWIDGGAPLN